ncbi:MAG: hypothetical protein M1830_000822 [Pleopsidium flavum]|nr:MAG: hypothetical protein M1830_000822 [Pleopsidium flavum]
MSVISVSLSTTHSFSKTPQTSIALVPNLGMDGDCHSGNTVQHQSRLHIKPSPLNLRQVHLIQAELLQEFSITEAGKRSYQVTPGQMGENITTFGIDLLWLSRDTKVHFAPAGTSVVPEAHHPVVRVTGLRNPCLQIDKFQDGLKERCVVRDGANTVTGRKAGIMSVVDVGGVIEPGQSIIVESPGTYRPLECV